MHSSSATSFVCACVACTVTQDPQTGRPSTVATTTSSAPRLGATSGAGGPTGIGGACALVEHAEATADRPTVRTQRASTVRMSVALDQGESGHLFAHRDH